MKKVKFELETIVAPEDLLKNELANIRGGTAVGIECKVGRVKCKNDGKIGESLDRVSLSVW